MSLMLEREALAAAARSARPGDTLIDAGASAGSYTISFARLAGPSGRVFAFEPDPVARALLVENLGRSRIRNVVVLPLALSNRAGSVCIAASRGASPAEVEATTVDVFCRAERLRPDGLRIDVGGAEGRLLEGAGETLRTAAPWVLLNLRRATSGDIPSRDAARAAILDALAANGARVSLVGESHVLATPPPDAALERFAGDPAAWVQPGDRRERPGDEDLGWGVVRRWSQARRLYTGPSGLTFDGGLDTRLFVHSMVHPLYEPARKAPHALCDAENLVVDFARLYPAPTLEHRPGYKVGDGCQYHRYRPGALLGACQPLDELRLERFSADHMRDIFASFRAWDGTPAPAYREVVEHPVLFVTREGVEARNVFHTTTDLLNALETMLVVEGIDRLDLEVVFLDNAVPAPYDRLWPRLFAPRRGFRRVTDFAGRRVLFRRAIFSPPGYHSPFFTFVKSENLRPHPVGLFDAFSAFVLRALGIDPARPPAAGQPLRATLVRRQAYDTHEYMARQLANEAACLDALNSVEGVAARVVDFALYPIEEQIRIAHETDILAGVHGGGLTHLLWMPAHGGLLEIEAKDDGTGWRCFRNLATWTGREYAGLVERERPIRDGTAVAVDPGRLAAAARDLAGRVRAKRSFSSRR